MRNVYVIVGLIGSEDATDAFEFPTWEACDAWMRAVREPEKFWYRVYA